MGATADSLEVGGSIAALLYDQNNDDSLNDRELEEAIASGADLSLLTAISSTDAYILYGQLPDSIQAGLTQNSSAQLQAKFFSQMANNVSDDTCLESTSGYLMLSGHVYRGGTSVALDPTNTSFTFFVADPDADDGGRHYERSPIVGVHAEELEAYETFALDNPALLRFGHALYFDNPLLPGSTNDSEDDGRSTFKMIPIKLAEEADEVARQLYIDYCEQNNLDPQTAISWSNGDFMPGVTWTHEGNEYNSWNTMPYVEMAGMTITDDSGGYYNPAYLVAIHELGHVERKEVGSPEVQPTTLDSSMHEVATVLTGIINRDYIYKTINDISLDEVVEYPELLPTGIGEGVNLGLVANTFRELRDKHGSIEAALMSDEGMAFVTQYYSNEISAEEGEKWSHVLNPDKAVSRDQGVGTHIPLQNTIGRTGGTPRMSGNSH